MSTSPSELNSWQASQKAQFGPDVQGVHGPIHFGNPHAEYAWALTEAALFDLTHHTLISLQGKDRHKFLHNFCTQDINGLTAGHSAEAFLTTLQGKVLDHVLVFAEPDQLWLETSSGQEQRVCQHLDRYLITEDVQIGAETANYATLALCGPESLSLLTRATGSSLDALGVHEHVRVSLGDIPIAVRRVDSLGVTFCLLHVPRERVLDAWRALSDAGAHPAGHAVYHALRIEAGWPLWGVDISDQNLAQEVARTSQAICFTKGCYLGQEPIARIDALGHVNQELRGLRLVEGPVPEPQTTVYLPQEVREAGHITSAALSFRDDKPVALALLKRNYTSPGLDLQVGPIEQSVAAQVFWPNP